MLLRKFDFVNDEGIYLPGISRRFEYFYSYWGSFKETEYLFFGYNRFETHRTLLDKIEGQLLYNQDNNYYNIGYFLSNPLFDYTNILIKRHKALSKKVRLIKELHSPPFISNRESKKMFYINRSSRQSDLLNLVKKVKDKYFSAENYRGILLQEFSVELQRNDAFTYHSRETIQFLINCTIVELYDYGYSIDYILKVANIIVFGDVINEYPYPKSFKNFNQRDEYESYKNEFAKSITIDKVIYGLDRILNKKKTKGYYIFKVNNLALINPGEVKIGEVTFYNPNSVSHLNLDRLKNSHQSRYFKLEKFQRNSEFDSTASQCNAIIESEFISSSKIESKVELLEAYAKIDLSLSHLNIIYKTFRNKPNGHAYMDMTNCFRVDRNKRPYSYNYEITRPLERTIDMSDYNYPVDYITPQVEFINNLRKKGEIGLRLYKILSLIGDYDSDRRRFSFKELWIAIESLMKKDELQNALCIILEKQFEVNYLINMKLMIRGSVENHSIIPDYPRYSIDQDDLYKFGLDYKFHKRISTDKFVRKILLLSDRIPEYLIEEFQQRIVLFTSDKEKFYSNLNKWINQVIDEFYIERNMEVHKSLDNNFSKIKLEEQIKFMVKILCNYLGSHIDMRNPNRLDLALQKLKRN